MEDFEEHQEPTPRDRVGSISAPFTMAQALRNRTAGFDSKWAMMLSREEFVFWEGVFRRKLAKALESGKFGQVFDLCSVSISLFSVVIYVMQTYEHGGRPYWYRISELSYSLFFVAEFFIRWYAANMSVKFFLDWSSIIDLLTAIPFLLEGATHYYLNLSFFRLARILKSLRIMRLYKVVQHTDSEVQRQLFTIIFMVVSSVFTISGLLHLVENEWRMDIDESESPETPKEFHDALYLTVMTMSTVGYGDFHPTTMWGKVVVMFGIFFTIVMIPQQMNRLVGLLSLKSIYARSSYSSSDAHPHVVVCGSVTYRGIVDFLKEFLHEDHGNADMKVVILSPEHPSDEMLGILRSTTYKANLIYIEGSCLQNKDLKRCDLSKSKACFVLSNQYCADPDEEDSSNIIRALAVKRFARATQGDMQVILQIIRPENKLHFIASMQQSEIDQIVCINEIKMSMLGQNCLCPGFSTLIGNLIQSSDSVPPEDASSEPWQFEYCHGCGYEFYRTPLSTSFEGRTFTEIVDIIYTKFECVTFAVEVLDKEGKRKIAVAPLDLIVGSKAKAYVLAPDSEVAAMISTYYDKDAHTRTKKKTEGDHADDYQKHMEKMRKLRRASVMSGESMHRMMSKKEQDKRRGSNLWRKVQVFLKNNDDNAATLTEVSAPGAGAEAINEEAEEEGRENASSRLKQFKLKTNLKKTVKSKLFEALKVTKSYHMQASRTVKEATIKDASSFHNHIVICGPRNSTPSGLFHLLAPLRRIHLSKIKPIVLMMPVVPDKKAWEKVSHLKEVYYLEGSPHQYSDLMKANVGTAAVTVILTATYNLSKNEGDLVSLIDADSIFSYQHIKRISEDNVLAVELVSAPNMAFLEPKLEWTSSEFYMSPCFASGTAYTASLLDTLVCQTYYNRDLLTIIRVLVCGGGALDEITTSDNKKRKQGFISQIRAPEETWGYRYIDFFKYLLYNHQMICLGLYRAPLASSNITSYVYTNPTADSEIGPGDRAFVICSREPSEALRGTNTDKLNHSVTKKRTYTAPNNKPGGPRESVFGNLKNDLNTVVEEEEELQEIESGFAGKGIKSKRGSVHQLREEFNSLKEDIALLRSEMKNIFKAPTAMEEKASTPAPAPPAAPQPEAPEEEEEEEEEE